MSTSLLWSVCVVEGFGMILNYGLNKVRFPSMLATGSRYRVHVELADARPLGEVSVEAGYTYKPGSEVEITVDGQNFKLFTQGGNAWAYDEKGDRALLEAMRAGRQMVVKGTSSRGTLTTDTYSLAGFSAALQSIDKACGRS